ncbi:DUF362 domain-containing protein [Chloroflexota bacterium]
MASKVYFMDGRSGSPQTSLVAKMETVFEAAGFDKMIKKGDVVAIKLHCGEWNNSGYLRPVYARALADRVKKLGGRPFVCDTTTQTYSVTSSRSTELDLLETAGRNGYNSATLGCPFICADGFIGKSDYRIDLPEGFILKEAYIAEAIAAADVLITLTHFKGHGIGVIGGALKNLGIGAQSKRGKYNVHMGMHPKYGLATAAKFQPENYKGKQSDPNWKELEDACPFDLIHVTDTSLEWERDKCGNCMACGQVMGSRGIIERSILTTQATDAAIADAALATVKAVGKGKVAFINMAIDISRGCDCVPFSDMPIVPNLGVFASFDPVAIDKACVDKGKEAHGVPGSRAEEMDVMEPGNRKFETCATMMAGLSEEIQIVTGEINGLGSSKYDLVEVEPKTRADFAFPLDPRWIGPRFKKLYKKLQPFPYDRHNGLGYLREEEVDLERVNEHLPEK